MAGCVSVRAYAELNDFLAAESRGMAPRRPFRTHQTVKDVLEAIGIPHTEVDISRCTEARRSTDSATSSEQRLEMCYDYATTPSVTLRE